MVFRKKTQSEPVTDKICATDGCSEPAEYKAPVSKERLGEYQWFCLDHIREFNRSWNYFDGMTMSEIEHYMYDALLGHRPTWDREGHWHRGKEEHTTKLRDAFAQFFAWEDSLGGSRNLGPLNAKQRQALSTLEMDEPDTIDALKIQYKKLVKAYHPDMHQGDTKYEEKFKAVTAAYAYLLTSLYNKEQQ